MKFTLPKFTAPSPPPPPEFSPLEVRVDDLIQLRRHANGLNLRAQRRVAGLLAGGYQSGFRGRGMEFAETRHYLPGDDIRAMDWRVTARVGTPHTKVFQEERERPVFIAVDFRPGMLFATRGALKSVQAARAATVLAWAAAQRGDRVGGVWFDRGGHQEIRPAGGKKGVLRCIRALADGHARQLRAPLGYSAPATSLAPVLGQLRRLTRPGSLICLFSDFAGLDLESHRALRLLGEHADVLAGFLYDPLERELPPPGVYRVSDGHRERVLDSAQPRARHRHQQRFGDHYQAVEQPFRARGLRLFPLATDQELGTALREGLGRLEAGSGRSHADAFGVET